MPVIRTVLGDIDPARLGATNAHEHLIIRNGLIVVQHPDYRLDSVERSTEEVRDFAAAGGNAIVEATPCGIGRDPDALAAISKNTGVHVIAATGLHKESYYLDSHWRFRYTAEQMSKMWKDDIEIGMERSGYEGPIVSRSEARAGVIKVGSDYQNIPRSSTAVFEAAALTHAATGASILTHSDMGTMMIEQVELLRSFDVDPRHVVVSHCDRNPDWFVHRDLAQTGAYLEYDCPGRIKYFPESTIVELIRKMFEMSLGGSLLLGGDNARRSYWKAYGGGPGIAYQLRQFLPRLRREGFSAAQIEQMTVKNPAAAFAFRRTETAAERGQ